MGITFVAHRGDANSKIAGMTLGVSPNVAIPVDALLAVRCVSTNDAGAASGDSSQHTVSDSQGNIYVRVKEFAENAVTDKLIVSIFVARITTPLTTGDTVTLQTPTETVRVIALEELKSDPGEILLFIAAVAVSSAVTSPSVSVVGLANVEHIFFGHLGMVGPPDEGGAYIQDSDYSNNLSIGTTGSGPATNRASYMGTRVATLTGDTFQPTVGNGRQSIILLVVGITTPAILRLTLSLKED